MRFLTYISLACILFVSCPGSTCDAQQVNEEQREDIAVKRQAETIPVTFVTLRNRTESSTPSEFFGGSRGKMQAGVCNVTISPIWGLDNLAESIPFYIPDEKIELTDIRETPTNELFEEIELLSQRDNANLVLYIHGYNIDFEKSCRRSAIFQRELGLQDRLLLFSWPADGNMLKYTWDEADLVWSVPHIARFLDDIVSTIGNGKVDIVAHSLGARGVVQALVRLSYREQEEPILNELILIAPDIDTDVFHQELSQLRSTVGRITVYVSDNDKALKLSQEVHGHPRLGQAGEALTVLEGVEFIDISKIANTRISGHLYHLFNSEVITDLTELLHSGKSADQRPSLNALDQDGLPYWQMKTDE